MQIATTNPEALAAPPSIDASSLYDMVLNGGPLMVPIALCSIVALAYTVERWTRLRSGALGGQRLVGTLVENVRMNGPQRGLELCEQSRTSLARILAVGLRLRGQPFLEIEKAVEDAGSREVGRLSANLRPLVVVAMIAPLLGLLGTVWGMIGAFGNIALQDGLGKPELLASGISQALITTAAGLAVAIPTQAAYYWFKSRIERFIRLTEDAHLELSAVEVLPEEAA